MGITKLGNALVGTPPPPKPPGFLSRWGALEAKGIGPLGLALPAASVVSGEQSVGGAVAGAATATAGIQATSALASKAGTAIAKAPVGSMVSKYLLPVVNKLKGKGPWGTIASFIGGGYAAMQANEVGSNFGDKYAPIWKKKPSFPLPEGVTPEQMIRYKGLVQKELRTHKEVPDLDTFKKYMA